MKSERKVEIIMFTQLKKIIMPIGVSGDEGDISAVLAAEIAPYVDKVCNDALGNLIAFKKGKRRIWTKSALWQAISTIRDLSVFPVWVASIIRRQHFPRLFSKTEPRVSSFPMRVFPEDRENIVPKIITLISARKTKRMLSAV